MHRKTSKVVFKTIRVDPMISGAFQLVNLSPEQLFRRTNYLMALRAAAGSSVASPCFSRYFCREGIVGDGSVAKAGNVEYGFLQALHGEESAVAAFRAVRERDGRANREPIALAILSAEDAPPRPAAPCGNCRDIMREDLGVANLEIVHGNPNGGVAVVVPMSAYLFDAYTPLLRNGKPVSVPMTKELDHAWRALEYTFRKGKSFENDVYSPADAHPRRKYCACIQTSRGQYFGAHDIMCDYHPIYALRDAARQMRRQREYDPVIRAVHIVTEGDGNEPPDVMYKDRQHLLELNIEGELVSGKENDPSVYLGVISGDRGSSDAHVWNIWRTSAKEWLPFPFTPRNFMDLGVMTEKFKAMRHKQHSR